MVCKRFADSEPCAWKTILSQYLKPVGDKIIRCCDFDVKKLLINLPRFYRECFECFMQCSAAARKGEFDLSHEEITNTQAQPGGVVGYQYTPFFPPGIPIYLKTAKKVDTKYLKLLPKRHVRQQRLV